MTTINFVYSRIGGAGKSFFAKVLCSLYDQENVKRILIDADERQDVAKLYQSGNAIKDIPDIYFRDAGNLDAYKADAIIDIAIEHQVDLIVNLPANCESSFNSWVTGSHLKGYEQFKVKKWVICTGISESLEMMQNSLAIHSQCMDHILVKNLGIGGNAVNWDKLEKELNDLKHVLTIDLPRLDLDTREMELITKYPFLELVKFSASGNPEPKERSEDKLKLSAAGRLGGFLLAAFSNIKEAKIFTTKPQEKAKTSGAKADKKVA
jgi:hypothetical protein